MGDVNLSILLGTIKWTGSWEAETTWYLGASGWAKKLCYFDFWNFEIMRFAGTVSYFCLDIPFFFPKALPQGLHITWCRSSSPGTSIVWIQNLQALKMNDFALYILVQFPLVLWPVSSAEAIRPDRPTKLVWIVSIQRQGDMDTACDTRGAWRVHQIPWVETATEPQGQALGYCRGDVNNYHK